MGSVAEVLVEGVQAAFRVRRVEGVRRSEVVERKEGGGELGMPEL